MLDKKIRLSDHFTIPRLLYFALPSIGMQIVDSTYQVADGYFISNYIGETAFGAENLIYPPLLIVMSVGLVFGTGASALLAREIGEGHEERASRLMTFLMLVLSVLGVLLAVVLYFLMPTIAGWVRATDDMMDYCLAYGRTLAFFMPFQMLSMAFHALLITAERPGLGLGVTISNAAANILLDWLFVAVFRWGMRGAALATGIAWLISSVIPIIFFLRQKTGLRFVRPLSDAGALGKTVYNGASEMLDSVAYAIVAVVFNLRLMDLIGAAGVEAYAVSEYVSGFFNAVFYGISMTIVPVVGFHLGKGNSRELRGLWHKGMLLMAVLGAAIVLICQLFAEPIVRFFVGYNPDLTALSVHALRLVILSFLFYGMTVYAGSYFTGLNQGTASLLIATVKGVAGPLLLVWLLPLLFRQEGLWYVNLGAELLAMAVSLGCIYWWWHGGEKKSLAESAAGAAEEQSATRD